MKVYAKILLLGEYSVITRSDALTIPFRKYYARLAIPSGPFTDTQQKSHEELLGFFRYIIKHHEVFRLKVERLISDLERGLYLDSTIPVNYGLGSSGALVAAIFRKYSGYDFPATSLPDLKNVLGKAESYYHGKSSGIDPLSSFVNIPLVTIDNMIRKLDESFIDHLAEKFFLYDTGMPSSTGSLVNKFLKAEQDKEYHQYCIIIKDAITDIIDGKVHQLFEFLSIISDYQYRNFKDMIPVSIRKIWKEGLKGGDFRFKLCGSGGGGYMLVYVNNLSALPEELKTRLIRINY